MIKINKIIIHCSDSPHGRGDNAETIHKWHLESGYDGIGYHYVILENGLVENGRPEFWKGAHAYGYNNDSIGICLIGEHTFDEAQYRSLSILTLKLMQKYNLSLNDVIGHCELNPNKTCPNFDIDEFKRIYFYQRKN